jgi:divalent metal cation (Fe/Co/Zn/Cd) transporter
MSAGGGRKAVLAAMFANAGISVTKLVAFFFSGSASMLSEAIHSIADTLNQGLLLVGASQAKRQVTADRPFGYGRLRYIAAFVVAIVLFLGGGVFSMVEGVHKWQHPQFDAKAAWLPIVVLVVALVLESFSLRTALVEAREARGDMSLARFIRVTRQPELPVVLLEDLGALLGLVFALAAVVLSLVTGDGRYDGAGAVAIGILLVVVAVILFIELFSMLIGESALPELESAIHQAVKRHSFLGDVIHLRTAHMGPEELLVGIKVAVDPQSLSIDVARAVDEVEAEIRQQVPIARWIYIETDVLDPTRVTATD